ncbi:MAG: LON peptidase substrate-binding domain-containing protein [Betaproteobacteria bacterium]
MTNKTTITTIPLFPLGATLFPGGVLFLKIFEVRYLEMIKTCVRDALPFGVVSLEQGSEINLPEQKVALAKIGTLAKIVHYESIQPNLLMIRCVGGERFTTQHCEKQKNGIWMADIEMMAQDKSIVIPEDLRNSALILTQVINSIEKQGIGEDQAPITKPFLLNDCGWVANRWSELLPLTPGQKGHLLGIENPRIRLDLICDFLEELRIAKNSD